jgi:hypothetical protein
MEYSADSFLKPHDVGRKATFMAKLSGASGKMAADVTADVLNAGADNSA